MSEVVGKKSGVDRIEAGNPYSEDLVEDLLDDALIKVSATETLLYALSESIREINSPEDALHILSNELLVAKEKIAEARERIGD